MEIYAFGHVALQVVVNMCSLFIFFPSSTLVFNNIIHRNSHFFYARLEWPAAHLNFLRLNCYYLRALRTDKQAILREREKKI